MELMSERQFGDAVIDLARLLGWRVAHFRPARTIHGWATPVQGDGAGFPDLVLVHPDHGILWRELKIGHAKLRPEQHEWAIALTDAGANFEIWTDTDWPKRISTELGANTTGCQYPNRQPSTGYQYGCRCERCRAGNAARIRQWRHEQTEPT